MPINAPTPTVVPPAGEEKVYDIYWLSSLNVIAFDPNAPVKVRATLVKSLKDANGVYEKSPLDRPKNLIVEDLFTKAAERAAAGKPGLALIIEELIAQIAELALDEGVIS